MKFRGFVVAGATVALIFGSQAGPLHPGAQKVLDSGWTFASQGAFMGDAHNSGSLESATADADLYSTMSADVQADANIVNEYWSRHWSEFFTGAYNPPGVYGVFTTANAPACRGVVEKSTNAKYCDAGDFVAFGYDLLSIGYQRNTNAWTALIVAHEWGHAIQTRLSAQLQSQARELQADCLAGAELYGAARDGTGQFQEGDEKAMVDSLTAAADATPWTQPRDHGDAFQRIGSFAKGRQGGVNACLI